MPLELYQPLPVILVGKIRLKGDDKAELCQIKVILQYLKKISNFGLDLMLCM